jgi:hypothetical protein
MKKLVAVIVFTIIPYLSFAQSPQFEDEIARFEDDTEHTMKCMKALEVFRTEFQNAPTNPYVILYFGRAFDRVASTGRFCDVPDSLFMKYADSAMLCYRLADKLQPGIRDKKFGFSMPVLIGHVFGGRCLWYLERGKYDQARQELVRGMNEGGYTPAQIEICRLMLDFCDSNAIFFTAGDDDTFPAMYLQMVEGYRTDVTLMNTSLACMSWYPKLFLHKKNKAFEPGFAPVEMNMTASEMDSTETVVTKNILPDRLYTDVDPKTRNRIHKELGIDVADKAEICFPVYQEYGNGQYYTYGVHKVIASILLANKWKRHVYFGAGGLESFLNCTHVAIRDGAIVEELYPINLGQVGHFKKGERWYHSEKMKKIFLQDAQMDKFASDQPSSSAVKMVYNGLVECLLALNDGDKSAEQAIRRLLSIPHKYLEGYEDTRFTCARIMYDKGFREEAKRECNELLPSLQKQISGSKTSFDDNDGNYVVALSISGRCSEAIEFINSFEIPVKTKEGFLKEISARFGCN